MKYLDVKISGEMRRTATRRRASDVSGTHLWLVLMKAHRALAREVARLSARGEAVGRRLAELTGIAAVAPRTVTAPTGVSGPADAAAGTAARSGALPAARREPIARLERWLQAIRREPVQERRTSLR